MISGISVEDQFIFLWNPPAFQMNIFSFLKNIIILSDLSILVFHIALEAEKPWNSFWYIGFSKMDLPHTKTFGSQHALSFSLNPLSQKDSRYLYGPFSWTPFVFIVKPQGPLSHEGLWYFFWRTINILILAFQMNILSFLQEYSCSSSWGPLIYWFVNILIYLLPRPLVLRTHNLSPFSGRLLICLLAFLMNILRFLVKYQGPLSHEGQLIFL